MDPVDESACDGGYRVGGGDGGGGDGGGGFGPGYRPPPRGYDVPCIGIREIFYLYGVGCGDASQVWTALLREGEPPRGWTCRVARKVEAPRLGDCRAVDGTQFIVESNPAPFADS